MVEKSTELPGCYYQPPKIFHILLRSWASRIKITDAGWRQIKRGMKVENKRLIAGCRISSSAREGGVKILSPVRKHFYGEVDVPNIFFSYLKTISLN
jgi:hypothetical protein